MDINLTERLKLKMGSYPKTRGRYSSSQLYGIMNGWITPEQWIDPPERDIKDILNMWGGIGLHNQLEDLMGRENSEKKKEYCYKDIVLVGKADFLPPHKKNQVWEFKTSENKMDKAKPWHEYQAKIYATLFDCEEGVIYQPVQNDQGIFLKHLGTIKRDDEWFKGEIEKLYEFHLKVEKIWKAKEKAKK